MSGTAVLPVWKRWRPLRDGLAGDIHHERWAAAGISPEAAKRLAGCRRSAQTIAQNPQCLVPGLTDGWNAEEARAEPADWVLLSGAVLWGTALRFGAGRFHREITRLVWRRDVDALKNGIGEDAYRFAVRQAPTLRRRLPVAETPPEGELAESVVASAGWGMGCCLCEVSPWIAGRVLAKLPPLCDVLTEQVRSWPDDRRGRWASNLLDLFAVAPAPL